MEHTAWAKLLLELGVLRIVRILRFFLGVEMVKVAEELVEPVIGRQELVLVAQVILAELPAHVAERLEHFRNRRVLLTQAYVRPRQPDLCKPGADRRLPGDERRPSSGATLLAIPESEHRALLADPIDVRRPITHVAA